ncbi:hypothetical protein L198_06989 [Cryptococcus wingfieldii CBS 7118]|uniref:Uncharacterized protein n=1 Tax=Cryptococcus wingfieldii CBS 7118 TaxID=1295528 RepID=A0A1E3IGV1_9TREE|nr:hypothetical protein L198_06989 [Cryptococcus wingfieldii CBS 7118]ODN87758.1 hypothetical protein L198_06989 [Cryptococcus wingfieldii CBS 7118]
MAQQRKTVGNSSQAACKQYAAQMKKDVLGADEEQKAMRKKEGVMSIQALPAAVVHRSSKSTAKAFQAKLWELPDKMTLYPSDQNLEQVLDEALSQVKSSWSALDGALLMKKTGSRPDLQNTNSTGPNKCTENWQLFFCQVQLPSN